MKFKKDPNAVLDYIIDFAAYSNGRGPEDYLQEGETISSTEVFSSPEGLVVDSFSISDSNTSVTIWVSGGTLDETYRVTCRIVTSNSRTDDRSISIKIEER